MKYYFLLTCIATYRFSIFPRSDSHHNKNSQTKFSHALLSLVLFSRIERTTAKKRKLLHNSKVPVMKHELDFYGSLSLGFFPLGKVSELCCLSEYCLSFPLSFYLLPVVSYYLHTLEQNNSLRVIVREIE